MGPCSLFATGRGSERLYESFHALPRRPLLLLVALLLSSGLAGGAGHVHDKVQQSGTGGLGDWFGPGTRQLRQLTRDKVSILVFSQNKYSQSVGLVAADTKKTENAHDKGRQASSTAAATTQDQTLWLTKGRRSRSLLQDQHAAQKQNSTSGKADSSELKTNLAEKKCYCGITGLADWQCGMQCIQVEELASLRNIDIVLYGDSQLESFRGNSWGGAVKRAAGAPEVWAAHYGHLTTVNMALAGQTASSLLRRLDNGALPQDNHTKTAVVWIGTNDLQTDAADKMTLEEKAVFVSSDIIKVCERLKQYSTTLRIVIMGLLPRGRKYAGHVPNLSELAPLPNKHSEPMPVANAKLKAYADAQEQVEFLDCTSSFITPNPEVAGAFKINMERAPDVLHFNTHGLDCMLTECLDPALKQFLAAS